MAAGWLSVVDTLLDVASFAMSRKARRRDPGSESAAVAGPALGQLETRLAGVVVAALREAFDRDTRRLEVEREQMERERLRAERMLRLELLRQTADREIGRLRLIAGLAFASWIGTLFFAARLAGGSPGTRVIVGAGWALLLVALGLALAAQSRVAAALARVNETHAHAEDLASGTAGALAPWLIVAGLAAIGVAVLMA